MTRAQFEARKAQVAPVKPAQTLTRAQFEARKATPQYASNVPQWLRKTDTNLRKFSKGAENIPRFKFAENIKNPVGKFAASVPESLLNTPSDFVSGAFGGYGEKPTASNLLKRGGKAVNVGLNIASLPGVGSIAKQGIGQGIKSGSGFGAAYGVGTGLQSGNDTKEQLKNATLQALIGGALGGVVGGTVSGASRILGSRNSNTLKTPQRVSLQTTGKKNQGVVPYAQTLPVGSKKVKQRGFAKTVSESNFTSPEVRKKLQDAKYTPQPNDELVNHATTLIKSDIDKATDIALTSNDNLGVATASELIKHYQNQGNFNAAANIAKEVATKLTEAGRTVQAASLYNKLTPEGLTRYAQTELSKEGLTLTGEQAQLLHQLASEANNLSGEQKVIATTKMLNKVQEFIPSKFTDQLTTTWKAGLLTNPTTHIANVGGNTTMLGLETVKDYPAVLLDKLASTVTGKRTKALPNYGAMGEGAFKGAGKAFTFMKTGVDVDNTLGKIDYKQVNLPPVLKQYTQAVFRTLGATDKVFKETLLKKSIHELAVVDGMNQGLSGKKLAEFTMERYANPTNQMVEQATKDALYGTFNNENALASALGKLKKSDSALTRGATELIAPFGRTPANIASRILDYSPAGAIKGIAQGFKGNQRGAVESLARAIVGSGIIGTGYSLGKSGRMTGNYPTNPTEQALWEATGKQPGALNVGGNWQSLNRISPVGNLLSIGSGMADLGRIKPENVPGAMLGVAGKNLLGQTYLQGVSGAANAIQDPQRYGKTWTSRVAQSVIPSVIGATARATDPLQRQSNSLGESITSRIPGVRESLLPKTDVFGRTLKQESNPLLNPFNTTKDRSDTTTNEIERLYNEYSGVSLDHPGNTASISGTGIKIEITPKELYLMEKQTGGASKKIIDNIVSSPQYQNMSDYDRAKAINAVISGIRDVWKLQNITSLSNFKNQLQQGIQEQSKVRSLKPFYTK